MSAMVGNAGPLIALAAIGQLGLLRELFGEVLVADEVRAEVEAAGNAAREPDGFRRSPVCG